MFDQNELSDLICVLSISKESAELTSRLNEEKPAEKWNAVTFYRNRDAEFIPFFHQGSNLVYRSYVERDLFYVGVQDYDANS